MSKLLVMRETGSQISDGAIQSFVNLRRGHVDDGYNRENEAYMITVSKQICTVEVGDFRPCGNVWTKTNNLSLEVLELALRSFTICLFFVNGSKMVFHSKL